MGYLYVYINGFISISNGPLKKEGKYLVYMEGDRKTLKSINYSPAQLKKILKDVKKNKIKNPTILFSPAAASFDQFDNFEHRGSFFKEIVNGYTS